MKKIAIVGSGIVGTTIAYMLTSKGYEVAVFEKGPDYPYPHTDQFNERIFYMFDNPAYTLPPDLKNLTLSGSYPNDLGREIFMNLGGGATRWEAITLRMRPQDFKTKSLFGYGEDWPVTYEELESYYCRAEALLGVSGTDVDNPFAPKRSRPFPLPPFELSYDDLVLSERLRKNGLILHTTPQARTRRAYEDRPACINFGKCSVCPVGARYSPNYHLLKAAESKRCTIYANASVRRIIVDRNGLAKAIIYHPNNEKGEKEYHAQIIIIAAGAIESARLLLLSKSNSHPDGIGNNSGQVGKHLTFHHLWRGRLHYREALFPGRFGGWTGQSHQFLDPPSRKRHGGIKIEFSSFIDYAGREADHWRTGSDVIEDLRPMLHWRPFCLHSESISSPQKYVKLSDKKDRFGDPFAHVHYESSDFDRDTYGFGRKHIFDRFAKATGADEAWIGEVGKFDSGDHHMGTCCMGNHMLDSVVDRFSKVHGCRNLFVVGPGNFVGSSGALNPTLTAVALAIRTGDYVLTQLRS